jgi:hypothetical protein
MTPNRRKSISRDTTMNIRAEPKRMLDTAPTTKIQENWDECEAHDQDPAEADSEHTNEKDAVADAFDDDGP